MSSPAEISGGRAGPAASAAAGAALDQAKDSGFRGLEGRFPPNIALALQEPRGTGRALALGPQLLSRQGEVSPELRQEKRQELAVRLYAENRVQSVSEAPAPRPETRNGDSGVVARGQSSDFGWQPSTATPHFLFPPLQPPSSLVAGPQDPLWRKTRCYGDARTGTRESWTETWRLGQRRCTRDRPQ